MKIFGDIWEVFSKIWKIFKLANLKKNLSLRMDNYKVVGIFTIVCENFQ